MISFVPSLARAMFRNRVTARALLGSSMPALGLAAGLLSPMAAQAQQPPQAAFGSMLAMQNGMVTLPDGTTSKWTGANRPTIGTDTDGRPLMTIQQTEARALLDWEDFRLQAGEVLEFQQQRSDWIAVNRVHGAQAAEIHGEIRAPGRVFVLNDNGVLVGNDAIINTRQLVTGTGVSDVQISGNTTTLVQSGPRSILEWRGDLTQDAGEVLRIQQQRNDWIQMNRFVGGVAHLNGTIQADGHLYLVAPHGLSVNGAITAHQVLLSQLNIANDQFERGILSPASSSNSRQVPQLSNYWQPEGGWSGLPVYVDAELPVDLNDPLRFNLTLGADAKVTTSSLGNIMLFGNNVTNNGLVHARDGQVIMAAGEHIWLSFPSTTGKISAYSAPYSPYTIRPVDLPYWGTRDPNEPVEPQDRDAHFLQYQVDRVRRIGFKVDNRGEVMSERGSIDLVGYHLQQNGVMSATSTALTKGGINFHAYMRQHDYEYVGPLLLGNGEVVFGENSVTTILPDLEAKDTLPLSAGLQSVGSINIFARTLHIQDDALIYMPSGNFSAILDAGLHVFGNNKGEGANQDNEDGTRFLMESGAVVDLSGWSDVRLDMESNTVSGRLFISQLKDSPLQRNGPLYRQLVEIDRRFGTNVADWTSFDNLSQATLPQLLINGGKFNVDSGNDFIMKAGAVIDVSGGALTYEAGYVNTTLLQTADGRIIDIREADPDELYVGLANQFVVQDDKWGQAQAFFIPLLSSRQGQYEESYQHGGAAGSIEVLAPDSVFQGRILGDVVVGKYQRNNLPTAGRFSLNDHYGDQEGEYRHNRLLIESVTDLLMDGFTMETSLSTVKTDLFGEEIAIGEFSTVSVTSDNGALFSDEFFNDSSMGSFGLKGVSYAGAPVEGPLNVVESGVSLDLKNGADFNLELRDDLHFLGSFRSEGGDFTILNERGVLFAAGTTIDTSAGWYSDFEFLENVPLTGTPRIHGGNVSITAKGHDYPVFGAPSYQGLVMPDGMTIRTDGGAWVDRGGTIKLGTAGNIAITAEVAGDRPLELNANLSALGLGGNGAFSLSLLLNHILISDTETAEQGDDGVRTTRLGTDFFKDAVFSSISLAGRTVTVADGTALDLTAATLALKPTTADGQNTFHAPTGANIRDLTEVVSLSPTLRPDQQRDGIDLSLKAGGFFDGVNQYAGDVVVGSGASIRTEAGGSVVLSSGLGAIDIGGDITTGGGDFTANGFDVVLRDGVTVSTAGVARVLSEVRAPDGRILREGEVLDGGDVQLTAVNLTIEDGSLIDVSGAAATFDVAERMSSGSTTRTPRLIASAGGQISLSAVELDVNDASYRANGGSETARGGGLNISFTGATAELPQGTPDADGYAQYIETLQFYGLTYEDGTPVENFFTADLSRIQWANVFGVDIDFPEGFTIGSREAFVASVAQVLTAAVGNPSLMLVGDDLPNEPVELPTAPEFAAPLVQLLGMMGGVLPTPVTEPNPVARISLGNLEGAGFSNLSLSSNGGIKFVGETSIGGFRSHGVAEIDSVNLAGSLIGAADADVDIAANTIRLTGGYGAPDELLGDGRITLTAGSNLIIEGGDFRGFGAVSLISRGDIYGHGGVATPGDLILQADQVYASTRGAPVVGVDGLASLTFDAGRSITVLAPLDGPRTPLPYEAAGTLTLKAPRITQGGVLRSPLGTINLIAQSDGTEGSGVLTLLAGSITSASADGRIIPFGFTANGDTFLGPNGQELNSLPVKTVNLTGDTLDLQTGALIDVSGGGDLFAYEFVEGVGGSRDWLTGYRDENFAWVEDASEVFAVVPSLDADPSQPNAGPQVYLSGGSGLAAGYYTLLPARYALLPGAFRVTARHGKGDFTNMALGSRNDLNDGSSVQAGYLLEAGTAFRDQRNTGFMVMPGATLRQRSQYVETMANEFFQSEAYLRRALRTNLPLGTPPRTPEDGGSVVLSATSGLILNATLESAGDEGARGGFADINAPMIAIVSSSEMTSTEYGDDYLLLDADQLSRFGAESLLIGGVRRQGDAVLEVDVSADTVIVSNEGSVLFGPEVILAARSDVFIEEGAKIEVRGQIGGSSGDLTLAPSELAAFDDNGTEYPQDDILIHGALDQGALVRVSSDGLVGIMRDGEAVDRMREIMADPVRLAQINARRALHGYPPLVGGGRVTIADGSQITGAASVVLDATDDTILSSSAKLQTRQLSASASRVSFGAAPLDVRGLVFAGESLGALGDIEDLVLKSYSTIDFYGPAAVVASGSLTLDGREIRSLGQSGAVSIGADTLQLTNTSGLTATAAGGASNLTLEADNLILGTGMVALTGFGTTRITASERVIGRGVGGITTAGDLKIAAGSVTAEGGAQMTIDSAGDVNIAAATTGDLSPFETLGATVNILGDTVNFAGLIDLSAGTVSLRARSGDVTLASGAVIDVTGDVSKIFDRQTAAPAGNVNLTADRGDLVLSAGSIIDLSGAEEGGNAGTLRVTAPLGEVVMNGVVKASANEGFRGGAFDMNAEALIDFGALNARLNTAGFDFSRRFKIARGDVTISGETEVQNFSVAADAGSILVTGIVRTTGEDGGSIRLSAAESLTLGSAGQLIARGRDGGSGGNVVLETAGVDGGSIGLAAGGLIDVSGTGPGGRTVRLRAPQIGAGDVAIGDVSSRIVGARSVVAEAYRTYDDVETIDQAVIDRVSADGADFMAAAAATRARLGSNVDLAVGIELRNDGDMTLTEDWNLADLRFDGRPVGLTLRAQGDLKFDANLSDGFSLTTRDGALLSGESASLTLTAGADLNSADSAGVLAAGLLAEGKGSVIIGGVADTLDYFMRGTTTDVALFRRNPVTGALMRACEPECQPWSNPYEFVELQFDEVQNAYLDPFTGEALVRDPETGQFATSDNWGVYELPYVHTNAGGYDPIPVYGNPSGMQIDRSDGYLVRTGTGSITVASGRDVVFEQKSSTLYTAGVQSAALNGFDAPTGQGWGGMWGNPFFFRSFTAYYPENGGDIAVRAQGDILGAGSDQFPSAWLWRLGTTGSGDLFADGSNISGRPFDQTTWFIRFDAFKAGIGALGGGNVSLQAGGDVRNVSVSIPSTGRVVGGRNPDDMPKQLITTGSGVMTIDAGGDILSGIYYVGDGRADLTAGGSIGAGDHVRGLFSRPAGEGGYTESLQDIYPLLFTSSAEFNLRSGGDLNVEAALDPMSGFGAASNVFTSDFVYTSFSPDLLLGFNYFQTYQPDAAINLFSAGGDVTIWNNTQLVAARNILGSLNEANPAPFVIGLSEYGPFYGDSRQGMTNVQHYLWPSKLEAVAAAGDVIVRGGFTMFPAMDGNLELLAGRNVFLDLVYDLGDPNRYVDPALNGWFAASNTIYISQSYPDLVPNPLAPNSLSYQATSPGIYERAGITPDGSAYIEFSDVNTPSLHAGDENPVRIYAADGDVFMNRFGRGATGTIVSPKPIWMFASDDIYFPRFVTQHNGADDRSVYRAGGSIFFSGSSRIHVQGPGQLEIEAGRDLYIPSQRDGIQSDRIQILGGPWKPEEDAADIAISVGYNQQPSYEAFEDLYLNPETAAEAPDYLLTDHGDGRDLSIYLIDPVYDRAGGPDQEFPTETREGLVNYVRRLQGLDSLKTKAEQLAYVDQAWAAWTELDADAKLPFYREVLFNELRTSGREATDPDSERFQSANRGYDAIKALFPGAEKPADEALAEGESRWTGDFETYLSVVRSNGGGDVEFVAPGGALRLANVLAPQSDPLNAGVVTVEGGEINIFAHDSVVVNESRILTAKGGNIMIWSSYGDIAAGRGARTSITPPSLTYKMNSDFHVEREPAGLPSGAGIGTLATVPGTPPADVDLVAPNGIVDAGDGGIRVSGNFNVFAVQVLGTDNIEVGGVATGLPQPPAQPPNSLDVDDAASKAADVNEAINDAVDQVRQNAGVASPSIIEVKVVGYGEGCRDENGRNDCPPVPPVTAGARASVAPTARPRVEPASASLTTRAPLRRHFNLPPQPLGEALRELGRQTGVNLVYDSQTLLSSRTVSLRGEMTLEQALNQLLSEDAVTYERTGPGTVVVRPASK